MFASYNTTFGDHGLIWIETAIRRGIPAIDIVGLPGSAIREARDRIRAAVRAAGLEFPSGHILLNLAPAGVPKTRACLDLALGLAILHPERSGLEKILVMGELTLSGGVRKVEGVLPALIEAKAQGIRTCIVPRENMQEVRALPLEYTFVVDDLKDAVRVVQAFDHAMPCGLPQASGAAESGTCTGTCTGNETDRVACLELLGTLRLTGEDDSPGDACGTKMPGHFLHATDDSGSSKVSLTLLARNPALLLGMLAAAAGGHHVLLYGPPGTGKTMAAEFLATLMPRLAEDEFLEVNRLYSLAGLSAREGRLVHRCPVRRPHHGSSAESILGARNGLPGEISLAHRGALILDECPEFRRSVLQSLREPLDEGEIRLGRVDHHVCLPASFMMAVTMNSCPCGGLGASTGMCVCNPMDVHRYWGRMGAPFLDRVDIRIRTGRDDESRRCRYFLDSLEGAGRAASLAELVAFARRTQYDRNPVNHAGLSMRNGELRGTQVLELEDQLDFVSGITGKDVALVETWKSKRGLRAWHSCVKVARTLGDLAGHERIPLDCLLLALEFHGSYEPVPGFVIQH